jgi:hypothetical protein
MTNVLPIKEPDDAEPDSKADKAIENFNKLFADWLRARARACDPSAPSDPKANDAHYAKLDDRLNALTWAIINTPAQRQHHIQEKFEILLTHIIGPDDTLHRQAWQMVASIQADVADLV